MSTPLLILADLVGLSLILGAAWLVQKRTGNSGWVDVIWTYGLGLSGAFVALWPLGGDVLGRQVLVATAVVLWSLRLGTHVARRTATIEDDPRYRKLKQDWGAAAQGRMFWFLQLQASAAFLLSLAVLAAARAPRPGPDWRDWLGFALVVGSILGEALSDAQLKAFARDPANKGGVCDTGLWRFSRHPNYFFETLGWVGYVVIAADPTGGYLWGWASLIGPAYMYYLLVYVSGVPPLEEHMRRTRPAAFSAYEARTNMFFPGPRRSVHPDPHGRAGA